MGALVRKIDEGQHAVVWSLGREGGRVDLVQHAREWSSRQAESPRKHITLDILP